MKNRTWATTRELMTWAILSFREDKLKDIIDHEDEPLKNYILAAVMLKRAKDRFTTLTYWFPLSDKRLVPTAIFAPTFEFKPFVSISYRTPAIEVHSGKRATSGVVGTRG